MKKIFFTIITLILTFFINYENALASTINIEDNNDIKNTQESITELKDEKEVKSKKSSKDLFGDEQTFPFVAGLGKNAAHQNTICKIINPN